MLSFTYIHLCWFWVPFLSCEVQVCISTTVTVVNGPILACVIIDYPGVLVQSVCWKRNHPWLPRWRELQDHRFWFPGAPQANWFNHDQSWLLIMISNEKPSTDHDRSQSITIVKWALFRTSSLKSLWSPFSWSGHGQWWLTDHDRIMMDHDLKLRFLMGNIMGNMAAHNLFCQDGYIWSHGGGGTWP